MTCPICGGDTKVYDSRPTFNSVKRRRECLNCNHRFSTIEIDRDYLKSLIEEIYEKED